MPSWYVLLLLALAAYRTWLLLAVDTITERVFGRVRETTFVDCEWCSGAWLALGWWAGYQIWPHWTAVVAVPFALSVLVGLLAKS